MREGALALVESQPDILSDQAAGVLRVDQLPQEKWTQARYQRFLGSISLAETVERPDTEEVNLAEASRRAAEGDAKTLALVRINAAKQVYEAVYKAAHVTRTESDITEDGKLIQFGQTHEEVYANTLRFCHWAEPLQTRARNEGLNGFRIEDLRRAGLLENYWILVPSLVPSLEHTDTAQNFFLPTMTAALQVTTQKGDKVITESAYVAGVTEENGPRHDLEAVRRLYIEWGIEDAAYMDEEQLLATPVAIPKELMPNGVVDIVQMFDAKVASMVGNEIFFGQRQSPQDYSTYATKCQAREASLGSVVDAVTSDMLRSVHLFNDPMDAVLYLRELVGRYGSELAAYDTSIDSHVFGPAAAPDIEAARLHLRQGDELQARLAIERAQNAAIVTGCPIGKKIEEQLAHDETKKQDPEEADNIPAIITCLKCRRKTPRQKVINPKTWRCPHCKYEVDVCTGAEKRASEPRNKFGAQVINLAQRREQRSAKNVIKT